MHVLFIYVSPELALLCNILKRQREQVKNVSLMCRGTDPNMASVYKNNKNKNKQRPPPKRKKWNLVTAKL